MNSNVYIVVYPQKSKFAEAEAINPEYADQQRISCPECGQFLSGSKWIGEKAIKLNKKNVPDFLYLHGGINLPFLISEKAYNILKENNIVGLVDAEIIDKIIYRGEVLDKVFYQIYLKRGLYPIDHVHSKIIYGQEYSTKCKLCNPLGRTNDFVFGLCFDPNANVDMDIFNIYEMGSTVFISDRFVNICKDNNLSGLCYENIIEYNSARGIFSEEEILEMLEGS